MRSEQHLEVISMDDLYKATEETLKEVRDKVGNFDDAHASVSLAIGYFTGAIVRISTQRRLKEQEK